VAGWGEAAVDAEIPEETHDSDVSATSKHGLCQTRCQSSEFVLLKDAGEWNAKACH